jgi:hypothetical protein
VAKFISSSEKTSLDSGGKCKFLKCLHGRHTLIELTCLAPFAGSGYESLSRNVDFDHTRIDPVGKIYCNIITNQDTRTLDVDQNSRV